MTDLVGQSDVRNCGWYVLAVIQQSHYSGVERLHATAIVLQSSVIYFRRWNVIPEQRSLEYFCQS